MLRKSVFVLIILFVVSIPAFSQMTDKDKTAELEKQAVDFLKDTSNEINILRTPENRISFNAELAALMWLHDEKQARAMFGNVITDFRQMLVQIDSQLNAQNFSDEETTSYMPFMRANDSRGKLLQKLRKVMSVRRQIASAIAENDALLGLEFFNETALAISNPKIREQYLAQDSYFETKLLEQIAEQNPDKILDFARQSLKKGLNYNTFGLLSKIYANNDKDGAAFGEEVFAKLKEMNGGTSNMYFYNAMLELGSRSSKDSGKTPLFSDQIMREAADLLGAELLKLDKESFAAGSGFLEKVEKYSPGRAAQVRQKFSLKKDAAMQEKGSGNGSGVRIASSPPMPPPAPMAIGAVAVDAADGLEKFGKGKLPEAEKEKFIAQARGQIAKIEDPSAKITMLSLFAAQMSKMGEQETALQLMKEAESFGTQYPKNYLDFLQNWMLASGYAQVAPEKAFPILEDSIYRLNETVSAFVKVGEFMDVNGDIIEDGEVQVGAFGGGMTKDLLRGLGQTNNALEQLAKADFARTKNLANRFERNELRILARMLILRAVFDSRKANKKAEIKVDAAETPTKGAIPMKPQADRP